jgi:type IV secretory pathway TrbD component
LVGWELPSQRTFSEHQGDWHCLAGGGLAVGMGFVEQVWRGFVLVPWFCTIWSVASLTLKKHKPQARTLGARSASVNTKELMGFEGGQRLGSSLFCGLGPLGWFYPLA